jgi:membrane protein
VTSTTADPHRVPGVDDDARPVRSPKRISARGWRDVVARTWRGARDDKVTLAAAGLAFYAMLSIFPALLAVVSIYGLVANPADVEREIRGIASAIPPSARDLLLGQLQQIVSAPRRGLGWGVALSIGGFLWSAASGAKALIGGVTLAYHEKPKRNFLSLTTLALAFTAGLIVAIIVEVFVITALPPLLHAVGLGALATSVVAWLRWPALVALVLLGLAVLYHYAPDRRDARFRWVTLGAVVASIGWTAASFGLSWYATRIGNFNRTYGTLGAIIVLLLWFYISALAILVGAVVNAEVERQTNRDSTAGKPKLAGRRGAFAVDAIARAST